MFQVASIVSVSSMSDCWDARVSISAPDSSLFTQPLQFKGDRPTDAQILAAAQAFVDLLNQG